MKKEIFNFVCLWAIFGIIRMFIHFKTKGKIKAKTKDDVFITMILPYMLSVITATFEFEFIEIKVNATEMLFGLIFFVTGSIIQFAGLLQLKNHFSNVVELQHNHNLVKTGIYKKIRHPIYLGIILQGISTILLLNVKIAGLFVFWSIIGIIIRIKREEKYLSLNLPGYALYRKESNALIPGVF